MHPYIPFFPLRFMLAVVLTFQFVFLGPWCRCWHQKIPILLDLLIRNQTSLNQWKVQVSCFGVWQLSFGIFIFLSSLLFNHFSTLSKILSRRQGTLAQLKSEHLEFNLHYLRKLRKKNWRQWSFCNTLRSQ
jgi:hypothetical protein